MFEKPVSNDLKCFYCINTFGYVTVIGGGGEGFCDNSTKAFKPLSKMLTIFLDCQLIRKLKKLLIPITGFMHDSFNKMA